MKSKTDNQMWEKKHRIRESQIEVDNGVHPLHWATSLGRSPMGTDPINLLKWYKMVLESTSAIGNRMMYKFFKTSLLEITISLRKQRKIKYNKECRLQKKQHLLTSQHLPKLLIPEK